MSDERDSEHEFASSIQSFHKAIESKDNEAATDAIQNIFAAAAKAAMEIPTVAMKLTLLAKGLEQKAEWKAAKDVLLKYEELAEAEPYLEEAFRLLEPSAGVAMAAGVQGKVANWWSVQARLQAARQDHKAALNSWRKAVETTRHLADLPHVEPAKANSTRDGQRPGKSGVRISWAHKLPNPGQQKNDRTGNPQKTWFCLALRHDDTNHDSRDHQHSDGERL